MYITVLNKTFICDFYEMIASESQENVPWMVAVVSQNQMPTWPEIFKEAQKNVQMKMLLFNTETGVCCDNNFHAIFCS